MQESEGLLEKNSEAVLKAARLGDLAMLAELHKDGFSLLAIDETAKVTDSAQGFYFIHGLSSRPLSTTAPGSGTRRLSSSCYKKPLTASWILSVKIARKAV